MLVAVCGMLYTFLEYHKADSIYSEAVSEYVTIPFIEEADQKQVNGKHNDTDENINDSGNNGTDGGLKEVRNEWYELVSVDIESLQAAYPDAAGWIFFENECISYPIMYSGDNEKPGVRYDKIVMKCMM